ncbi:hypothetical protein [Microbispora hainanensis]|uniref:Uncharacterized protein n=1 Tax=Microbispora hainanensis TaxID=568844 RepID=A0A544YMT0_9ACTN|nr:hypothetical protein [Microbispora hainanensis]TQS18060.1 hypothetical protein FLX08_26620 [Microbispora hainanensis]
MSSEKKFRRLISALASLAAESNQLIHLPHGHKRSGRYEGFQLLDEGGVRPNGDSVPYVVPRKGEDQFGLPYGLFENGWIHVLEDAELLLLLSLAHHRDVLTLPEENWIKIESGERLHNYGLGRDAYQSHEILQRFGLLEVDVDPDRRSDGTLPVAPRYAPNGPLHRFRILETGFDEPALEIATTALRKLLSSAGHSS